MFEVYLSHEAGKIYLKASPKTPDCLINVDVDSRIIFVETIGPRGDVYK